MELDFIPDDEPLPEDDIDDCSGTYRGASSTSVSLKAPMTRSRGTTGREAVESGLMVRSIPGRCLSLGLLVYLQITSSSPHSPESFQVWVHLHPLSNNTFVPPQCAHNGYGKRRLWLTRLIGFGSTGNVWQCRLITVMVCLRSRLLSCSAGLTESADNDSLGFTLPWKWRTNLGNSTIASLRTAMGHLRVMGSMFSFLNYAMALSMAGMS
jgi:hypothetical protein